MELYEQNAKEQHYDAIIVPGYPYDSIAGLNTEKIRIIRGRILWGKYLYDQGITDHVIFSGSAVYTPFYEAIVMKLYAIEFGLPKEVILTETRAQHSVENVYYCYQIAQQKGWSKVALATDPYQSRRMKRFIRRKNLPIPVIPFVEDILRPYGNAHPDEVEVELSEARADDFVSIKERKSLIGRLIGTRGGHIEG